jgi:hypothetical protein
MTSHAQGKSYSRSDREKNLSVNRSFFCHSLYKVVNGERTQLGSADIPHTPGWHTLRVTMKSDQIECYYDNKKHLDAKDSTIQNAGKIGLWTKADAQSHFDDLAVSGK